MLAHGGTLRAADQSFQRFFRFGYGAVLKFRKEGLGIADLHLRRGRLEAMPAATTCIEHATSQTTSQNPATAKNHGDR